MESIQSAHPGVQHLCVMTSKGGLLFNRKKPEIPDGNSKGKRSSVRKFPENVGGP